MSTKKAAKKSTKTKRSSKSQQSSKGKQSTKSKRSSKAKQSSKSKQSSKGRQSTKSKQSSKSKSKQARRGGGPQRTASRTSTSPKTQDAIGLLQSDHREVEELVERFEKARGERKEGIAREICLALTVHSQLEEELVYPIARELLGNEGRDLIDEADVEHATVKRLVVEVESSSLEDALYEAKVRVIGEYVKHHVQEEEKELFPKLRSAGVDLRKLGDQLAERKAALMQEWQQAA